MEPTGREGARTTYPVPVAGLSVFVLGALPIALTAMFVIPAVRDFWRVGFVALFGCLLVVVIMRVCRIALVIEGPWVIVRNLTRDHLLDRETIEAAGVGAPVWLTLLSRGTEEMVRLEVRGRRRVYVSATLGGPSLASQRDAIVATLTRTASDRDFPR